MSAIVNRYGKIRTVKNLGWLRRHWKEVDHFEITLFTEPYTGSYASHTGYQYNAKMIAHLREGMWERSSFRAGLSPSRCEPVKLIGTYETVWASKSVLHRWLDRPVFRGIRVIWFGTETKAGAPLLALNDQLASTQ